MDPDSRSTGVTAFPDGLFYFGSKLIVLISLVYVIFTPHP